MKKYTLACSPPTTPRVFGASCKRENRARALETRPQDRARIPQAVGQNERGGGVVRKKPFRLGKMNESGPLEHLYRVQQLDLELDGFQAEELRIPDQLRDSRGEQERINNTLEDTEIELENVEKNVRQLEFDLTSTKDQVARNKVEQDKNAFNAKVQSQYENLIQQLSERVSDYEESLAPLYERRSALETRRGDLRGQHAELRPTIERLEGEDEARVNALREQHRALKEQRDALAASVDPRTLKEYEMIRKAKRGLGLVTIEAGRCTGCNMQLPVTVQQRAGSGKLPPVKCPSCGRFLYKQA